MAELRRTTRGTDPASRADDVDLDFLAEKRLLVVTHGYTHFVKEQVDVLSEYVESVHVLVRYNRLADLASYLPLDYPKPFTSDAKIDRTDTPDNVTVIGTPLYYLPVAAHRRILGDQHARAVRSALADLDVSFDLIHSHLTWTAGYVGSRLQSARGVPHVLTVHENRDLLESEVESERWKLYHTWETADALVRVNRADLPVLGRFNDAVRHVPNGFSPGTFQPVPREEAREVLDLPVDRPFVFALGHLKERKGFHHLIEVMPTVREQVGDVGFAIGGHGGMRSTLEAKMEALDLADDGRLLGYVPRERLKYWMSAADAFVLPSYSESFGLVQLEAMACGTPVVSTVNGGSEEVVVSEEHGLLVDGPEAHGRLADAVVTAIERDWDREAIRRHAEEFTWENVCAELAALYVEQLRAHGAKEEQ